MPENNFKHYSLKGSPRRVSKKVGLFPAAIIILIVIMIVGAAWFFYQEERYHQLLTSSVDQGDTTSISLITKKGQNPGEIADNLLEKKLILDKAAFIRYLKEQHLDTKILVGRFVLNRSLTIPEIAEDLSDPKKSQIVVTILEGQTIRDIDRKLVSEGLIQPNEFINALKDFSAWEKYPFLEQKRIAGLIYPLEGYLFPDTYFLDPTDFTPDVLVSMMLKDFRNRINEIGLGETGAVILGKERSLLEIVTMASIIEKEVRTKKDLPIVSGILWKRLDENWQLGADATLLYLNDQDRELTYDEIQAENEYNTRKNLGLPPSPINNPGIKSIEAALHPETSPYYFYLTKPDTGEVVYAVTNEQHNANKAKYL